MSSGHLLMTIPFLTSTALGHGRPPLIQNTMPRTALFVYVTLTVTFLSYARFCYLVINDITDYLGIACFTVRKKDKTGDWVNAADVNGKKQ